MSVYANIDISVVGNHNLNSYFISKILINSGWNFSDDGKQTYIPLHDNEEWNWESKILTSTEMDIFLLEKSKANEIIVFITEWKNTNIGGQLLIYPDLSISFILNKNRVDICDFVDFNWYLLKIVPLLRKNNINIDKIECVECGR